MQTETKAKIDKSAGASGQPVTILRFIGDISSTSREAVLGTYEGLAEEDRARILLDFSKVEYINSSGIALIIQMLLEANKSGRIIRAFGLTPHFQKVFTMVGITRYTSLFADEPTAKASF
jgi:anti-sigma B factor antagonist